MYVDHYGQLVCKNLTTGDQAVLNFSKKGWFEKVSHEVQGTINDKNGNPRFKVSGQWNDHMHIQDLSSNKTFVAWEKYPYPQNYDHNYFFSEFAIQLNIPAEMYPGLPKTDSRYRPDQRALENGDIKLAGSEKNRVEQKQRLARSLREENNQKYLPKWFKEKDNDWVLGC